tara:strand:+ start:263 stop:880 length:618 start_codon:yes stop_codon:yes gene_type:complete
MTTVKLHGILAREYGESFKLDIENPQTILKALDCNRVGFIARLIQLQKEGLAYDIIVNKKRIEDGTEMERLLFPQTIDLVPAIAGSGILGAIFSVFAGGGIIANIALALVFAAVTYALSPKPEQQSLEIDAAGSKTSLIFSNIANVASQGAAVPLGYGRLKVGSQVIQATIKSYPQGQRVKDLLEGDNHGNAVILTSDIGDSTQG